MSTPAKVRWFLRREGDPWSVSTTLLGLLLLAPLLAVLTGAFETGAKWDHLVDTVLAGYVGNTALLVLTVCALSAFFALPAAWLVSTCEFPGRRLFEWALAMPLAIPTYVAAFAYYPLIEDAIPVLVWVRREFGVEAFLMAEKVLRYGLLSILLAAVLYPYLYLSARASFTQQRKAVIEASRMLGASPSRTFFRVALPLARPAVVAGLSLILMEVINDYGAVHFFGVPTLTEGIFRTWFGLQDSASAIRLAAIALLTVLLVLVVERRQRGAARYAESAASSAPLRRTRLHGGKATLAWLACALPLAIGFLFPVGRLSLWASWTYDKVLQPDFLERSGRSLLLALGTALVLALLALLFAYSRQLHSSRSLRWVQRLSTLGYAVPGAVIAAGMMVTLGALDRMQDWFSLQGSLFAIGFAYCLRFLCVAYQPVSGGFDRLGRQLGESSRMLGQPAGATLFRIHLPLMTSTLIAAAMLVFIDILKELPLTMILRPANFETLATSAFGLAKEGRFHESAVPSLLIIAIGTIGIAVLNRFLRRVVAEGR